MERILIISFTDLRTDARVRRQVIALRGEHAVTTAALHSSDMDNDGHVTLDIAGPHMARPVPIRKIFSLWILIRRYILRKLKWYDLEYWSPTRRIMYHQLRALRPDVIVANDIETLPLALKLAGDDAAVVFDAHEYSPRQHDDDPDWVERMQGLNEYMCRTCMPAAAICFTVSDGIAAAYEELTGVRPVVLMNAPAYQDLEPRPVDPDKIKLVHHGIFNTRRRTLELVRMMDGLTDGHELHLFGPVADDPAYARQLNALCDERANVHLHPSIPPNSIPEVISAFDIGIHHLHGGSFNHQHALPNKFFDFIQARLAMVVGPNPEMAGLVTTHGLGVVSKGHDMDSFLQAIRSITPADIMRYKMNANECAKLYNAEKNMALFNDHIRRLCSR